MIAFATILLILLTGAAISVGASMGLLGMALIGVYSPLPMTRAMGEIAWTTSSGFLIVSIPLFIMLGEILLRSGIADRMYAAVAQWLSWLPGGLMHSNIGSCALFAAVCGSSAATAATVGTVALPQLKRHGYNEPLFLGSLAAGGTLGILIPPSINMIVYGIITNTSIPKLYLAGVVPGIVLSLLFMLTILVACMFRPTWRGRPIATSWRHRMAALGDLLAPLLIFVVVIGSIYLGWATATESAALGVVTGMALAALRGRLSMAMMREVMRGTMRTTAMIMLVVLGAFFLNYAMTAVGMTKQVTDLVESIHLGPIALITAVIVLYLILGMLMDAMAMMIATTPIVAPIVFAAGYDPVWFGILMVVLMEAAMITPPVGINLFVVQGIRREGSINDIILGMIPFCVMMVVLCAILIAFPDLALWLPRSAQ